MRIDGIGISIDYTQNQFSDLLMALSYAAVQTSQAGDTERLWRVAELMTLARQAAKKAETS
jgi:hypothetical protein